MLHAAKKALNTTTIFIHLALFLEDEASSHLSISPLLKFHHLNKQSKSPYRQLF